jgi:carboxymethylenebutenolidase
MPLAEIKKLENALQEAGVTFESEVMTGAAHGYAMTDLPMHNEAAEERHWQKLLALLKETLG